VILAGISTLDFTFAATMPTFVEGILLLLCMYVCFGLGNGATFQLVPQRWQGRTGVMTGIIGAAGGIGGFYLPLVMSIAKQSTGSYRMGFAIFGAVAAFALLLVIAMREKWLTWAEPTNAGLRNIAMSRTAGADR